MTTTISPAAPAGMTSGPVPPLRSRYWAAVEFLGLVVYQTFHQMEHTLAVANQKLGATNVHPLLGGIDFEWLHLGFNGMLLWGFVIVLVGYGAPGRAVWRSLHRPYWRIFVLGIVVQSYHVLEHVVRTVQYVQHGGEPPGIATQVLDPAWFHFGINLAVLLTMAVGFFGLRIPSDLRRRPRRVLPTP